MTGGSVTNEVTGGVTTDEVTGGVSPATRAAGGRHRAGTAVRARIHADRELWRRCFCMHFRKGTDLNLNIIHHIHSVAFGEGDPRPHKADYRNSNKSGPGALGGTGRSSSAQRGLDGGRSCRLPPRREAWMQAWTGRARQLREPLTAGPSGSHVAIARPVRCCPGPFS